jgi:hypothetical protein
MILHIVYMKLQEIEQALLLIASIVPRKKAKENAKNAHHVGQPSPLSAPPSKCTHDALLTTSSYHQPD